MNEQQPPVRGAQIFVSELRLNARVGVDPGEQGAEQPIVVDLWVGLEDIDLPARSERLRDTLDYVAIARTARRVVEQRHWPLVEGLATSIGQAVLDRPGATWVRVRLRKLNCLRLASAAGVEVELGLDDSEVRPRPVGADQVADPEEIVVVGGGAAGMAATLWCWRLGHPALLVDPAVELGGQLHLVHGAMPDLPGMNPMTGRALARRLWRQVAQHGGRWLRARALEAEPTSDGCHLRLALADDSGELAVRTRTVILASGVRRRELGVPGERELAGRGLLATAARDAEQLAGKRVVVIGGGDSACENAVILARGGAHVTLCHRRDRLAAREQLVREVSSQANLTLRHGARPLRFRGAAGELDSVELETAQGTEVLPARAALVRIGWVPNSEGLPARWLDGEGYLRADVTGRVEGERAVFGVGDLLGRISPSVATAYGSAAAAARAAVIELEA